MGDWGVPVAEWREKTQPPWQGWLLCHSAHYCGQFIDTYTPIVIHMKELCDITKFVSQKSKGFGRAQHNILLSGLVRTRGKTYATQLLTVLLASSTLQRSKFH